MFTTSTSTPSRRLFFVVFVAGVLMLAVAVSVWSGSPRHSILAWWDRAPDRAAEGQPGHRAFLNVERRCKWQTIRPDNYDPLERGGSVPFADETYSVDEDCVRGILRTQGPYTSVSATLGAVLPRPQSAVAFSGNFSAAQRWNSEEPLKGDLQLYREQVVSSLARVGIEQTIRVAASEQCIRSVPKWCVISGSEYYSDTGEIISETPSIQLALVIAVLGALGSFFPLQVSSLWRLSFGRLIVWIRKGR